ncbi:mannose-6-phosphate isomerase, class I [Curtobacterium sp. MCJR17_043]|uniref:mannose-6-phosphate isomerase, class I n=1 Tax=Curtobacterium sp. MCJR17_043 TaxID=2175660 RepID=UPI0024E03AA7|nr:mannose-6-phosphate isomerase, class I [Curtobacterium sp. MCJR17_043]WIB35260.1 mannose-6-phosphate isomerase, class I [Curtobacterium sp. MCJR17_043]
MFLGITNTPRDYAWGSVSAIPELLGRTVTGVPQAELWLGAHAGSPSVVVNPAMVGGADTVLDWITAEPETALGTDRSGLPFLLKVLAAAAPLSLQAHPTPEQAREGFDREEAAGVPLDDPARNYKDPFPKPELVVALSERFEALSGFRPVADALAEVEVLDAGSGRLGPLVVHLQHGLEDTVRWLEETDDSARAVIGAVGHLATEAVAAAGADGRVTPNTATAADLARAYPEDPGVVVSLLMHRVTLARGEAMYLPAGNIHAYLDGLGIELMAPSDNVLRGGPDAEARRRAGAPARARLHPTPGTAPRAGAPRARGGPVRAGGRRLRTGARDERRATGRCRWHRAPGRAVDRDLHRGGS